MRKETFVSTIFKTDILVFTAAVENQNPSLTTHFTTSHVTAETCNPQSKTVTTRTKIYTSWCFNLCKQKEHNHETLTRSSATAEIACNADNVDCSETAIQGHSM